MNLKKSNLSRPLRQCILPIYGSMMLFSAEQKKPMPWMSPGCKLIQNSNLPSEQGSLFHSRLFSQP
ncbi:unnamed protein product [Moneuplotes crassus]|uniref:Uncharacterized protein n=1 Tax=Euplotes crassus TaxID=5936 RepID=A0AAD1UM28_EUPCR|nr:unnamed protein product [Moneuplotes crassus]